MRTKLSLPPLSGAQRLALGGVSAFLVLGSFLVPSSLFANAQNAPSEPEVQPIAFVEPKGGDARRDITYDPYQNVIDGAPASASVGTALRPKGATFEGGGPMGGPPDVQYGQSQPVDTSLGSAPGSMAPAPTYVTGSAVAPRSAAGTFAHDGDATTVSYVGATSGGVVPIAILRDQHGHELVVSVGDVVAGAKIARITPERVTLADGRSIPFTGGFTSARGGSAAATSLPPLSSPSQGAAVRPGSAAQGGPVFRPFDAGPNAPMGTAGQAPPQADQPTVPLSPAATPDPNLSKALQSTFGVKP